MKTCTCIEFGYRADGEWGEGVITRAYRRSFDFHGHTAYVHRTRYGNWAASVLGTPIKGGDGCKTQAQAERLAMVCAEIRGKEALREALERAEQRLAKATAFGEIVKIDYYPKHKIIRDIYPIPN